MNTTKVVYINLCVNDFCQIIRKITIMFEFSIENCLIGLMFSLIDLKDYFFYYFENRFFVGELLTDAIIIETLQK